MKKNKTLLLIFKIYLLTVSIFFIFRLLLFASQSERINEASINYAQIFQAFINGIRFDIVIIGYIIFIPSLVLLLFDFFQYKNQKILKVLYYWILILFIFAFVVSAADIPYFNQFFTRMNIGAFEWMDNPVFVFKMLIEEPSYVLYTIPWAILVFVFYKVLKKIFYKYKISPFSNTPKKHKVWIYFLVLLLIFLGIRGRVQTKSPIRVGTAYFCDNPFLNQLGLNPNFTLIRSFLNVLKNENNEISLMNEEEAIKNVQSYLHIKNPLSFSPIARKIVPDTIASNKPNVVIIMMESMAAYKMGRYGNKENLTPFLDSLCNQSYYFEHYYTTGEHTFNGIFSTLFSYPALYRQHTMKSIRKHMGISYTLKKMGYSTSFFTTHDSQFDNMEGFLRANDFTNIISQAYYPSKEIKTTLGVPDDYMFRYAIPYLNKKHKQNKPFLVAFMTTSDHGPFYIPKYFKPRHKNIKLQATEYADWSLQQFMKMAKNTDWFNNTIFVFTADHGAAHKVKYPISLNYHHSPLLIYAPQLLKPQVNKKIASQMDIFPTIMGLLKQTYINNTMGIDLLTEKRAYVPINGDDKVALLDTTNLFILQKNGNKLYHYRNFDRKNYIDTDTQKAQEMSRYLKSTLQAYQAMIKHKYLIQPKKENSK